MLGLLLSLLAGSATAVPARNLGQVDAESAPGSPGGGVPIMIVMDLSGSMSEDDGTGTVKLDGAKAALTDVARDIPMGTEVGLWTYPGSSGVTSEGCPVGEPNFALGTLDPTRISAEVAALTADGNTPTGPALQAAVDHMKAAGRTSGLMILVSDGLSNCGRPPCEVAQEVVDEGFDVTAAVAGFQVSGEGRSELECVANVTGGVYRDAKDSEDLADAIREFVGPRLQVEVTGQDGVVVAGTRQTITATIRNVSPALSATNVSLSLAFADAGPGSVFPAVLPPRLRLGNIPANASVTRSWQVSVPTVGPSAVASPWVTVQAGNTAPVLVKGAWRISDEALTLADAGPILKDTRRVAILGDSYSSGEGTFDYLPGTDTQRNGCHRSIKTYGLVLFAEDGKLTVEDGDAVRACSGAVTQDFFQEKPANRNPVAPKDRVEAQSEQLGTLLGDSDRAPDVLLMTFGGNDVGFADVIVRCALPGDCTDDKVPTGPLGFTDCAGGGSPAGVLCPGALTLWTDQKHADVRTLGQVLAKVYISAAERLNSDGARADRGGAWAPVIVLGYPQILAENDSCSHLDAHERNFGIEIGAAINDQVAHAVEIAAQRGLPVYYAADVANAFLPDHTVCTDASSRWVNPIAYRESVPTQDKMEQMHPNVDGFTAMTSALVQWSQQAKPLPGPFMLPPDAVGLDGGGTPVGDPSEVDMDAEPSDLYHQTAPEAPLHVTATGLAPDSRVLVTMYSVPQALGTLSADSSGRVDGVVMVPQGAVRGPHTLVMEGIAPNGDLVWKAQAIKVILPMPWWGWLIAVVSASCALGAAALIWRRRASADIRRAGVAS